MKKLVGAVVTAVVVCACGLQQQPQYPYGQSPYGQSPYGQQQQQPPAQQSVTEYATFKVDSTEKVITERDGGKIQECSFQKTDDKVYLGVHFVSADGHSSLKLSISNLDANSVSASWSGNHNRNREVTLQLDDRQTLSKYSNQVRSYTASCTLYYELEGKLLRVRHFSCDDLQNSNGDRRTGKGAFSCYLKSVDSNSTR